MITQCEVPISVNSIKWYYNIWNDNAIWNDNVVWNNIAIWNDNAV